MSARPRMLLFFHGNARHLEKLHDALRLDFPEEQFIAVVAATNREARADRQLMTFHRLNVARYTLLTLPSVLRSAMKLRNEQPDCTLIFYDSLKHRLFAGLTGARRCVWMRGGGYHRELPPTLPGLLLDLCRARVLGLAMILRVYATILLRRYPKR